MLHPKLTALSHFRFCLGFTNLGIRFSKANPNNSQNTERFSHLSSTVVETNIAVSLQPTRRRRRPPHLKQSPPAGREAPELRNLALKVSLHVTEHFFLIEK